MENPETEFEGSIVAELNSGDLSSRVSVCGRLVIGFVSVSFSQHCNSSHSSGYLPTEQRNLSFKNTN